MPVINIEDLVEDAKIGWVVSAMAQAKIQLEDHRHCDPVFYVLQPDGELVELALRQFGKLTNADAVKRMQFFARRFARERKAVACTYLSDVYLTELHSAGKAIAHLTHNSDIDTTRLQEALGADLPVIQALVPGAVVSSVTKREALVATIEGPQVDGVLIQYYKRDRGKIVFEETLARTWSTNDNILEQITVVNFTHFLPRPTPTAGQ